MHTTFVSADRKLRRVGGRRCLFITRLGPGQRANVHLLLRVNANAPAGNLDNIADIEPDLPPVRPPAPPSTMVPDVAGNDEHPAGHPEDRSVVMDRAKRDLHDLRS